MKKVSKKVYNEKTNVRLKVLLYEFDFNPESDFGRSISLSFFCEHYKTNEDYSKKANEQLE